MMETHSHHIDSWEPCIKHWHEQRYLVDTLDIKFVSDAFDDFNVFFKHRLTQILQVLFNIL